ncbi:hypothetical protein [Roseovarius salis]|uniref:hypothetical protein n=1 Tax=Roseovarius salis TaxID=3376063 RepID=UPI0037CBF14D
MTGSRSILSTVMAAAIALSALSAAPARADSDAAKIIAGAAAIGIIAAAIAEANDDDRAYVTRHGYYDHHDRYALRKDRYLHRDHYHRRHGGHAYRKGYRHGYRDGYRDGRRHDHYGHYRNAGHGR